MDFVVANPAWLAIICFGVVSIISGIMLTGRDLDPIERVLPSISAIQKWCGIAILFAAVFVFLASPLPGKHLWEAEQQANQAKSAAATAALAAAISEGVIAEIDATFEELSGEEQQVIILAAAQGAVQSLADQGAISLVTVNAQETAGAVLLAVNEVTATEFSDEAKAELEAGIATAIGAVITPALGEGSPGALTNKADVTFYNPLSAIWGTMLGVFAIMVLVFSAVTSKYGDQKPLSTMLAVLWPVLIAMAFYTWKLKSGSEFAGGDIPGVMLDMFILLVLAIFAIPMCVLGMREKPREAGEYSGYIFILMGIDAVYIGIKYLWLFEVQPFLHLGM